MFLTRLRGPLGSETAALPAWPAVPPLYDRQRDHSPVSDASLSCGLVATAAAAAARGTSAKYFTRAA